MKRLSFALLLWAAAPAGAVFAQAGFDVISLYEGSPKRGSIVEMSKDSVGLDVAGVTTRTEVGEIKRVTFSDAPPLLTSAQTSIASGQLEDAMEKLKQIDKGSIQRDIVAQEVDYYLAYCATKLALAGSFDQTVAARAILPFANNTGSYHYYEANELMGDLAAAVGKPSLAQTHYSKIGEAPWPEFKMRASVLEGQALLNQDMFREAGQKFQSVVTQNLNTPTATRQKELANLGMAKCFAALDKAPQGVEMVEKIIANGDSRDGELFARAYNALGFCHLKAGNSKDALLAYLHVDLMFYQEPAQHAEALYYLRTLWKDANDAKRALSARTLLKQRYAGSAWASRAD
ncbi:MAG: hypothetical protein KDA41_03580 [Planctomycetales bacterium]|nr:hypothetical protein [Planctomycetales bacterium]